MDKTFAETKGKKPFDWNGFLGRAINGRASLDEQEHATYLSGQWVTCACGNQCAIIPRLPDGGPVDNKLDRLGMEFCSMVEYAEYVAAKDVLHEIEARSAILIAEELAKLNAPNNPVK